MDWAYIGAYIALFWRGLKKNTRKHFHKRFRITIFRQSRTFTSRGLVFTQPLTYKIISLFALLLLYQLWKDFWFVGRVFREIPRLDIAKLMRIY